MAYDVVTLERAELDIDEAYRYIREQAEEAAVKWYTQLRIEIESLSDMPSRYGLAPEAELLKYELRQKLFGKRSGIYRVIFRIDEPANQVHILAVRHGARRSVDIVDIE